jgi:hypothetical protein
MFIYTERGKLLKLAELDFDQSGQTLKALIGAAIERLFAKQIVGKESSGIKLRR